MFFTQLGSRLASPKSSPKERTLASRFNWILSFGEGRVRRTIIPGASVCKVKGIDLVIESVIANGYQQPEQVIAFGGRVNGLAGAAI